MQLLQGLLQLLCIPTVSGRECHQGSGRFDIAFAAAYGAGLSQGVALSIGAAGAAVMGLADVEQEAAGGGKMLHGSQKFDIGGSVALAITEQDGGLLGKTAQTVGNHGGSGAGSQQIAAYTHIGLETYWQIT